MKAENEIYKAKIHHERNELKHCPFCCSPIADRTISIYKELIDSLYKVYCWCGKNGRHEFSMKDIRDMLDKNDYARFGDLVHFGGIVYRPKDASGKRIKAQYGINMGRAKEFFKGDRKIPMQLVRDQIKNVTIEKNMASIDEFPSLRAFIKQNGLYDYEVDVQKKLEI